MSCRRRTKGQQEETMGQRKNSCESVKKAVPHSSILRLNSTGEVSSDSKKSRFFECCNKKFVDNMKVGAIIDSANMYLESAASYLGSWSPKTTCNFSKPSTAGVSAFDCVKAVVTGDYTKDKTTTMAADVTTRILDNNMNPISEHTCNQNQANKMPTNTKSTWSCSNLLGALQTQCNLLNSNNYLDNMNQPKVQRYVPPQKRVAGGEPMLGCGVINRKLTPYNAKLLEKSRKCQSSSEAGHPTVHTTNTASSTASKCSGIPTKPCVDREKVVEDVKHFKQNEENSMKEMSKCDEVPNVQKPVETKERTIEEAGNQESKEANKQNNSDTEERTASPDWFDYDCPDGNINIIPITINEDKLHFTSKPVPSTARQVSTSSQESNSGCQQLHNWFSVEFDADVRKKDKTSINRSGCKLSSQNGNTQTDKSCGKVEDKPCSPANQQADQKQKRDESSTNSMKKVHMTIHTNNQAEKQTNDDNVPISKVLFIRNCGKKGRPSKKKRTRQKSQETPTSSLKPGSAVHPNSPVTVMFGVDSDSGKNNMHSFQFTTFDLDDDDTDSDWSDSGCSDDEDFSSLEEDKLLGLRCNDPLAAFNVLHVSCSIQPTSTTVSPASPSYTSIDEINQSWQIRISFQSEPNKKSTSSKKVHFADDNKLATVHPIVAWRYAYAAARVGPWEQYARDRARFKRRICGCEPTLTPVLNEQYRETVFRERFDN